MSDDREILTPGEELYAMLPWYATGKISPADRTRLDQALAADPALRAALSRIEEEREETVLANQAIPAPRAGGIDALMSRIEAEAPRRDRSRAAGSGWLAGLLAQIGGLSPRTVAIGALALALVVVAEGGALLSVLTRAPSETGPYVIASLEPPVSGEQAVLLVAFTPTASMDAVGALLRSEKATIIDGPKAGGLYRISVASTDAEAVLADLKAHPDLIRFAGPGK
jgi:anti-sigma factor RsiW